jgi:hypothetical protein
VKWGEEEKTWASKVKLKGTFEIDCKIPHRDLLTTTHFGFYD